MKLTQEQIEKLEWRLSLPAGTTLPEMAADLANRDPGPPKLRKKLQGEAEKHLLKARQMEGRRSVDVDSIDGMKRQYKKLIEQANRDFRAEVKKIQKQLEPVILDYIKEKYGQGRRVDDETIVYGSGLLYNLKTMHFKRRQTSDAMDEELRNLPVPASK